jgi:hypothetical protein
LPALLQIVSSQPALISSLFHITVNEFFNQNKSLRIVGLARRWDVKVVFVVDQTNDSGRLLFCRSLSFGFGIILSFLEF